MHKKKNLNVQKMESLPGANKRQIYSSGLGYRTLTLTDAEASPKPAVHAKPT